MNYRMKIQYDGTRYKGWQRQAGSRADTVQARIETVLSKYFCEEVLIHGAGRTDAGVHARGQVANFHVKENCDPEKLLWELNAYLPEDIRIMEVARASERFHSRLNATGKRYEYRILKKNRQDVFGRKYAWHCDEELDVEAMRSAAKCLEGKHDFAGFCTRASKKKSTLRRIYEISIMENDDYIVLQFAGNGFLYNMVRILTGTLVEVGMGARTKEEVTAALETKDRNMAGATAPAQGLTLLEVTYD
ncbi:MAG: tRNA pseudouridine(38-40) synthase TruA [Eubacterium sp.]|nr:tRNA pseudouridine(38-40) synthase TruA [Eubacterium sp.]